MSGTPVGDVPAEVRRHVSGRFAAEGMDATPDVASVTFLGCDPIDVLRFGPDPRPGYDGVYHYVSLGCSRYPMNDPSAALTDPLRGPRAEIVMSLRSLGAPLTGLARSMAVLAATPAVEGVVLRPDALIDLSTPLWAGAPFAAVLLGPAGIEDLPLPSPRDPVRFLEAVPVSQVEAAWVRLKGADALRQTWSDDGVDVLDPGRPAGQPGR